MESAVNVTIAPELDSVFSDLLFIEDATLEYVGGGTITNTL